MRVSSCSTTPRAPALGFDAGPALTGPVPVKLAGRVQRRQEPPLTVDADLTQAKIDNLMPGWVKPPGKPNRATFTVVSKDKTRRGSKIS